LANATVWVSRALDLEPQRPVSTHLGNHEVAVVDVGFEAGGEQAAAGAGQDLGFDHQLDERPERGALDHPIQVSSDGSGVGLAPNQRNHPIRVVDLAPNPRNSSLYFH
jgi:hypothetical protein